jgi:flagellar biosynthesis component FlhA
MSVNFTAGLVTLFCTTPAAAFLCCFLPLVALLLAIDISDKMQRKTNDTKEKKKKKEKKIENKIIIYAKVLAKNPETATKSSNYFLNAKKPGLRRRRRRRSSAV